MEKGQEVITSWTSHKHPMNANFMQVVKYTHIQYADGRQNLHWRLNQSSANDHHLIANISLLDAKARYEDAPIEEISEEMFLDWLSSTKAS